MEIRPYKNGTSVAEPKTQKHLNICLVSEEEIVGPAAMIPGGIGQYILRCSESLVCLGHNVTVLCRSREQFSECQDGVRMVGLVARHSTWGIDLFLWLHRREFDIIEVPEWGGHGALSALLLGRRRGKVVTRGHGHSLLVQRAHGEKLRRRRQYWRELIQLHCSSGILANSGFLRESLSRDFYIKKSKIGVCHIGINQDAIGYQGGAEMVYNGPVMIYVGGMDRRKGPDLLLKVLSMMIDLDGGANDIKLLLVGPDTPTGPGGTSFLLYCEQLARDLGVWSHVEFIPLMPRNKLELVYKRASVFVSGSHVESLGMPFLEAMSIGIPVCTWKRGAAPEIILDSRTGRLFPYGDFSAFARGTLEVLTNETLWRKMSVEARLHVGLNFLEGRQMATQVEWYSKISEL